MPTVVAFDTDVTAEHMNEQVSKLTTEQLVLWCKSLEQEEGPATRCYIEFQSRAAAKDFLAKAKKQELVLEQVRNA